MGLTRKGYRAFQAAMTEALTLAFWVALSLTLVRVLYMALFSGKLDSGTGASQVFAALKRGFLFDMQVGFYLAIPAFLIALAALFLDTSAASRWLRKLLIPLVCYLTAFNAVAGYHYIKEYGDLYNEFLLGLVFDDREAILKMIWQEYHVIPSLIATVALGWLMVRGARWLARFAERHPLPVPAGVAKKLLMALLLLAVMAAFGRGGVGPYPILYRDRDATADQFLNKLIMNPWSALHFSIQSYLHGIGKPPFGKEVKTADLLEAARRLRPDLPPPAKVTDVFARTVAPSEKPKARQVFLIVIESYDAWPFLDKYSDLKLVENGKKLAAEGLFLRSFTSTSVGTMTALSPIISGLYNPGVHANYLASSAKPYETAPAETFRRAGFRTRMISGGSLSWQKLGDFSGNQGFDERYGMESITAAKTVNEWGVDDGSLFEFVLSKLDDRPSFNLILTTGNHPSYKHDIKGEGWSDRGVPESLKGVMDGTLPEVIMGHLWYSDLTATRFAREVARRYPDALVAITGDHFSRKFLNVRPPLYEGSSVPLILYGPKVLGASGRRDEIAGNHLDILPTLYQLSLPEGTPYRAVGTDLLDPSRAQLGFGLHAFQGPGYVVNIQKPDEIALMDWGKGPPSPEFVAQALNRRSDLQLLSWWRLSRGDEIK